MPILDKIKTRFAPTPSGYLHLGNAFSFILTWLIARKNQGKILLRIDDLDNERSRPEYIQDIFESLLWLELDYDEGPQNVLDFAENYSQKLRLPRYQLALEKLQNSNLVYACVCSRKQIQKASFEGIYPNTCREASLSLATSQSAWRIQVSDNQLITFFDLQKGKTKIDLKKGMGDFIIKRKDDIPAYQLVSLVDDMDFGVNFIVRGLDLWTSSAAQVFLAEKIQLSDFQYVTFYHHPLLKNFEGIKLSKSAGDLSLQSLRNQGLKPLFMYQFVSENLGIPKNNIQSLDDLLYHFSMDKLFYLENQNLQMNFLI